MNKEIKLNLNKLFWYVLSCEINNDAAKYYTPLFNDKDKQELINIVLEIRLSGRNTWSESSKARIAPYLLKFAPIPYKGNSCIKPVTNLEMLEAEECYSMLSNWNFFISDAFFLYKKDDIRALIMVAEEFGIPTPKIIDPNDYLTAKQRNTVLAEMNALMAEQS